MATFIERHREMQEIVRELAFVRNHNLAVADEVPQKRLLHFAEGLLVILALERFLRIVLEDDPAAKRATLNPLPEDGDVGGAKAASPSARLVARRRDQSR